MSLHPKRVIFNTGTENPELYAILKENKILKVENNTAECTLDVLKNSLCDYKGNAVYPFKEDKACLIFLWAKNKTIFDIIPIGLRLRVLKFLRSKFPSTIRFPCSINIL